MNLESLLITLIIGAIAGWLAGTLMKGSGFGLIANIALTINVVLMVASNQHGVA